MLRVKMAAEFDIYISVKKFKLAIATKRKKFNTRKFNPENSNPQNSTQELRLTIMANSWIFIHDHGIFNTIHTFS